MEKQDKDRPMGLALLRKPFPEHQISKLPKPLKKDAEKGKCKECGGFHGLPAAHLEYVGHAALTDRLLEADINWNWEPLATHNGLPMFDAKGGLWIRLTVCGMTRLGYGNAVDSAFKETGSREKEVIGDALRNAAMRFGAALDLWHKGALHLDQDHTEAPKTQSGTTSDPKQPIAPASAQPPDRRPDLGPRPQFANPPKPNFAPTVPKPKSPLAGTRFDTNEKIPEELGG